MDDPVVHSRYAQLALAVPAIATRTPVKQPPKPSRHISRKLALLLGAAIGAGIHTIVPPAIELWNELHPAPYTSLPYVFRQYPTAEEHLRKRLEDDLSAVGQKPHKIQFERGLNRVIIEWDDGFVRYFEKHSQGYRAEGETLKVQEENHVLSFYAQAATSQGVMVVFDSYKEEIADKKRPADERCGTVYSTQNTDEIYKLSNSPSNAVDCCKAFLKRVKPSLPKMLEEAHRQHGEIEGTLSKIVENELNKTSQ